VTIFIALGLTPLIFFRLVIIVTFISIIIIITTAIAVSIITFSITWTSFVSVDGIAASSGGLYRIALELVDQCLARLAQYGGRLVFVCDYNVAAERYVQFDFLNGVRFEVGIFDYLFE
jgi:hypothetical protein